MDCCRKATKQERTSCAQCGERGAFLCAWILCSHDAAREIPCKGLEHLAVHTDVCLAVCVCLLVVPRSSQWEGMMEGDGSCCCGGLLVHLSVGDAGISHSLRGQMGCACEERNTKGG